MKTLQEKHNALLEKKKPLSYRTYKERDEAKRVFMKWMMCRKGMGTLFMKNMKSHLNSGKNFLHKSRYLLTRQNSAGLIANSFYWHPSEEGYKYWASLSIDWVRFNRTYWLLRPMKRELKRKTNSNNLNANNA